MQTLPDYLAECAQEISKAPFIIRFTFDEAPNAQGCNRIRSSLNTYFIYLADTEVQKILQLFRRASILFFAGLCILVASVWLNLHLGEERSMTANVFAEGLTIAAWVSLWESLAIVMLEWFPHRKSIQLYRRLARAALDFRQGAVHQAEQKTSDLDP